MNRRMTSELDNYITGHYGEDQFRHLGKGVNRKKLCTKEVVGPLYIDGGVMDEIRVYCEAEKRTIEKQIQKILSDWVDINRVPKRKFF